MDFLTIGGILFAFGGIFFGYYQEGGSPGQVLAHHWPFLMILSGSMGAQLVSVPMEHFKRVLKVTRWLFLPPKIDVSGMIEKLVEWAQIARREGLLGLEGVSETEDDEFARKGLRMLVDGREPQAIRKILEVEIGSREKLDLAAAKFYEGMGGFAPTIGIVGAVLGLIVVMENLSDPAKLGQGIATAFIATVYALLLANVFFLPFGAKLKTIAEEQAEFRDMIIEGLVLIAEGENPRNIEEQLQSYTVT
ncbi:MAG: flagellar motor protein [Gammaproteobacteria bacterium]|jgi:chemotaxis protein MotA|nr:flagellar motor protein [Gammaproteobacteria bacterium]MBT5202519.1 flagellar motor protein [Gammaproteobacteria bacterium]MBT5601556.1 flagellar motor protein [Gammaproteobacteria bacterium]MBT6247477.1 flagellar motor protein [Gammaproteobacteria bacterium]